MKIARIILGIISVIIIIITLIKYYNFKKELNNNKRIKKEYITKKIKEFNVLLVICIICGVLSIVIAFINNANKIRENKNIDINKYLEIKKDYVNNSDVHSNLNYFPNEINNENVIEFSEFNRDGLFDGSYFILLNYKYNDNDFNKKYEELKNKSIKKIEKDNLEYLIISDDTYGTLEYVIINEKEKNTIYIFNQLFVKEDLNIDKQYFID